MSISKFTVGKSYRKKYMYIYINTQSIFGNGFLFRARGRKISAEFLIKAEPRTRGRSEAKAEYDCLKFISNYLLPEFSPQQ